MATLTRYTAKFYKDSSKVFYAVFISASENPITSVEETSKKYSYTTKSELLSDSSYKHVLTFSKTTTGSGTVFFNITFDDGTTTTASGQIPSDKQILVSPHDSLSFSTSFSDFNSDSGTYSISDSVYYSKSPYKTLYIFPSSSTDHLSTSSTEDFYYTTAGSAAYIGSSDLQNAFLNSEEIQGMHPPYDWGDVVGNQLGRFIAGNGVQVLNFAQYTDASKTGPVVYGYVYVNTTHIPEGGTTYNVSKNRASSNYYLKGCRDFDVPCTADGVAFSTDCITGTTLTAAIINDDNNIFQDGHCAATCEGFSLKISNTRNATTAISADGVILAEVIGGKANYTFVLTAIEIGPGLSYGPTTVSGVTTDTREFTGLYAGKYTLKVTDANTSACILTENFIVTSDSSTGTQKGCRQSGAVNYDSGIAAANGFDQLCVYCNSGSGLLIQGVDENNVAKSLGPFAKVNVQSIDHATSLSTTGASNNDGRVILNSLDLWSYNLGFGGKLEKYDFNSGDYFSGGTDFEYKLYSLPRPGADIEVTSAYLAANGTVIATQSNINGAAMGFSTLAPANYAVKISYTNDSGGKEYEDCYIVEQFVVKQEGCTDPNADNYNRSATINDGSCYYRTDTVCALDSDIANIEVVCTPDTASRSITGSLSLRITLPEYDGSSGADGDALAAVCNMTNPASLPPGNPALGSQCYFRVNLSLDVTGQGNSDVTIHTATVAMTFDQLCSPGGYTQDVDCGLANVVAVGIQFSYGGDVSSTYGGAFSEDWALNQGDCDYNQTQFLDLDNSPFDACGCNDDEGGDDEVWYGCTDPDACNGCNPTVCDLMVDDGSCEYTSCIELGCTDPAASNYSSTATEDDGSCTYPIYGCTDSTATNYNPSATEDDGTCDYTLTPCEQVINLLGFSVLGVSGTFPDSSYTSTTESPYVYNSTADMCLEGSPYGTITVTLPTAEILANTDLTELYWYAGIINTSTGQMKFNFTDQIYQVQVSNANGTSLQDKFIQLLLEGGEMNTSITGGDLIAIDGSYEFSDNITAGNYVVMLIYYSTDQLDPFGSLYTLIGMCGMGFATAQVSLGACTGQPEVVPGCTDMSADNYNSLATDDDGTCTYSIGGCMDVYSANYNSNASFDDGSCNYNLPACSPPTPQACAPNIYVDPTKDSSDTLSSCCIPQDISQRLAAIEECLTASGSRFYNKMITGLSDTCSTMDAWKMVLILEILRKKGLPCVYNCSDQNTPDLQNTTCKGVWEDQGSNIWYSTSTYQVGSVVQSPVNDQYYVAINSVGLDLPPNTTVSNADNAISGWVRCCDEAVYSGNINYLTKFLSFVEKYCKDCEILPYKQDTSVISTEIDSGFTIGGAPMENNGSTFGDS